MICVVCKGSGSLITFKPKMWWWGCPGCGGCGAMQCGTAGPIVISNSQLKRKKPRVK